MCAPRTRARTYTYTHPRLLLLWQHVTATYSDLSDIMYYRGQLVQADINKHTMDVKVHGMFITKHTFAALTFISRPTPGNI